MDRLLARGGSLALALLVALTLAGCASGGSVSLKETDLGEKVTLSVGQQMEITLESNPTTGYSWQVADDAGGIVEMVGEPEFVSEPAPAGMVGRGGAETLTFRAEEKGGGTLVLEYRRPWEKGSAEKTIELAIEVE